MASFDKRAKKRRSITDQRPLGCYSSSCCGKCAANLSAPVWWSGTRQLNTWQIVWHSRHEQWEDHNSSQLHPERCRPNKFWRWHRSNQICFQGDFRPKSPSHLSARGKQGLGGQWARHSVRLWVYSGGEQICHIFQAKIRTYWGIPPYRVWEHTHHTYQQTHALHQ